MELEETWSLIHVASFLPQIQGTFMWLGRVAGALGWEKPEWWQSERAEQEESRLGQVGEGTVSSEKIATGVQTEEWKTETDAKDVGI